MRPFVLRPADLAETRKLIEQRGCGRRWGKLEDAEVEIESQKGLPLTYGTGTGNEQVLPERGTHEGKRTEGEVLHPDREWEAAAP